jgi:acetoin utilization deacetylase AcuC-like enzyme
MHVFFDPCFLLHHQDGHPEGRQRLTAICRELEGLKLVWREPPQASEEQLVRVHHPSHVRTVREASTYASGYLDPDTYVNDCSYQVALKAAGAAMAAVDAVMDGDTRAALALVRPPGHHATPSRAMGFCLFNNVAVAAAHALRQYGLKKAMIIDWDVHHGNGTQAAFYSDPRVLFLSLHQFPLYPGTGRVDEVGEGEGMGATINVPLPPMVGDEAYVLAFERVVIPAARRFRPELLLISAGYDAHWTDPLANMKVTVPGFWQIARRALQVAEEHAQGRIVVVLEGGYSLRAVGACVLATVAALQGEPSPADPCGHPQGPGRDTDAEPIIEDVRIIHSLGKV